MLVVSSTPCASPPTATGCAPPRTTGSPSGYARVEEAHARTRTHTHTTPIFCCHDVFLHHRAPITLTSLPLSHCRALQDLESKSTVAKLKPELKEQSFKALKVACTS